MSTAEKPAVTLATLAPEYAELMAALASLGNAALRIFPTEAAAARYIAREAAGNPDENPIVEPRRPLPLATIAARHPKLMAALVALASHALAVNGTDGAAEYVAECDGTLRTAASNLQSEADKAAN